ncbi:hypothetical protein [Streptomyces sp. NPDC048256]|uniref:hypothetical protein n=1 Tax=Streptomyces sp. NPDC048256 TaxID=3154613 RepID=UPI0033F4CDA3
MSLQSSFHDAVAFLSGLRIGDTVRVTREGRTSEVKVIRPAHRSDGPFGDYTSVAVTVSHGPGRHSFEVTAEAMAPRKPGLVVTPQTVELVARAGDAS